MSRLCAPSRSPAWLRLPDARARVHSADRRPLRAEPDSGGHAPSPEKNQATDRLQPPLYYVAVRSLPVGDVRTASCRSSSRFPADPGAPKTSGDIAMTYSFARPEKPLLPLLLSIR